ncbi:MAG: hypothetical protein ACREBQ_05485 [Nitrososphaerales archaeon]
MPIEFTSDQSKKSHRAEERYQYLRYLFLAVIGSSAFLYFSFGYPLFLVPIGLSAVFLAYVEYKRTRLKRQELPEAVATPPPRKAGPSQPNWPGEFERPAVAPTPRKSTKPEDILMIVAPACLACAVIAAAAYQTFQQQIGIGLGNTTSASLDLLFAALFGVTCFGLLVYIGMLLRQRSRLRKAPRAKQ